MCTLFPLLAEEEQSEEKTAENEPSLSIYSTEFNLSASDLKVLPNGGHVASLLEFLFQPAVLSNTDTGGFSSPERVQVSMFGESHKWQRWYFLGADISNPSSRGEPLIYMPLGVLENITTRKYAVSEANKNGIHLTAIKSERAQRFAELSLPFAVGGIPFIPRATADREPASDWGAPTQSRAFVFPSAEGRTLIPLGQEGYIFADAQTSERKFNTLKNPERTYSSTLLGTYTPRWVQNDSLFFSTQLRSRSAWGAEYFMDEKETLRETQYAALLNYAFDNTKSTGSLALGYAYRSTKMQSNFLNRSLINSLLTPPPTFPQDVHTLFWDASGFRKKELSWARIEYGTNSRLETEFRRALPNGSKMAENLYGTFFALTEYESATREANYLLRWQPFVRAQKELGKTTLAGGVNAHIDWGFTDAGTKFAFIHPAANINVKSQLGRSFFLAGALLHDTLGFSLEEVAFANKDSLSGTRYLWTDANGNQNGDAGELTNGTRTGGKYHSTAKNLQAPQKEELSLSFGYRAWMHWVLKVNTNARIYRNLLEVRYKEGASPGFNAVNNSTGIAVFNRVAGGNEIYQLTNQDTNAYYAHFEIQLARLPTDTSWIFQGSIGAYYGVGYTPHGLSAFYNDTGVYNESTADTNFRENRFGRLDNDRGYMGKIVFGYKFARVFSAVNVLRYRDGEPMVRDELVTGLAQGPIVVPLTERGGGVTGIGRHTYSFAWDLRLRYETLFVGNTAWAFLDIYNLLNSRTELAEYPLSGTSFRDPVEQGIERTVRLGLGMNF
ncbi:MAG: hypothetical protein LDLANPLL_01111 [Turneriella sp.]|nr:hypothetical protein [Turneriella sp.]